MVRQTGKSWDFRSVFKSACSLHCIRIGSLEVATQVVLQLQSLCPLMKPRKKIHSRGVYETVILDFHHQHQHQQHQIHCYMHCTASNLHPCPHHQGC